MHKITEGILADLDFLIQSQDLSDAEVARELEEIIGQAHYYHEWHKEDGTGGYVTTYSGKNIVLADPDPDLIIIEDIAHHLSQIPHWNGAAKFHFSVGQHSLLVESLVPRDDWELREWALMHDSAEYIYGDDTRPKKKLIPQLRSLEKRGMEIIANKFGLSWPEPGRLKYYDDLALEIEKQQLMPADVNCYPEGAPHTVHAGSLGIRLQRRTPEAVETDFLTTFHKLFTMRKHA